MDTEHPLHIPEFISEEERQAIKSWIQTEFKEGRLCFWNSGFYLGGYKFGDPTNQSWEGGRLKALQNIPNEFFNIQKRITELFPENLLTPGNTAFVNYFEDGGRIQKHTDGHIDDHWHVRCNVLIVEPKEGMLVVNGKECPHKERELVCFLADKHEHEVMKVSPQRIVLSYAMVVPKTWFKTNAS